MIRAPAPEHGHTNPAHAPAGLDRARVASPRTVTDACAMLADALAAKQRALVLAGGTDVIVDRHLAPIERATPIDLVVDVTAIDGFQAIAREGDALVFGGGVTYWDLRASPIVNELVPMLPVMARDVGAVQIQTRGTLAGNVATASPAADGVAALMALDARVRLESVRGARDVLLEEFFTGYRKTQLAADELITRITVSLPHRGAHVRWRKVGTRLAQAISKVALASVVHVEDGVVRHARFGMASVAATTHPLREVRALVQGKRLDAIDGAELDAALARDVQPIDDVRSTGPYRAHVARALVRQAIFAAE